MKLKLLTLFISISSFCFSQGGLIPSLVKDVYNFNVGDTFEYAFSVSNLGCGYPGTILKVVTSVNIQTDSITYTYKKFNTSYQFCPPLGPVGLFIDTGIASETIHHPDSSIFACNGIALHYPSGGFSMDTCHYFLNAMMHDSAYISRDSFLRGKKFDETIARSMSSYDVIYADSLGIVSSNEYEENTPSVTYNTQLIYYHKVAHNQIWGTFQNVIDTSLLPPSYHFPNGVADAGNSQKITVYPNPSTGSFTINLGNILTGAKLTVVDVLGQIIFDQEEIKSNSLNIKLSEEFHGTAFVRVEDIDHNIYCTKITID